MLFESNHMKSNVVHTVSKTVPVLTIRHVKFDDNEKPDASNEMRVQDC